MTTDSLTLLKQIQVLDPVTNTHSIRDILLDKEKILKIDFHIDKISSNTEIINGKDLIFAPGLVDLYSYSQEPGHESRETLENLAASAIAGGFTRVGILPQTIPPVDTLTSLTYLQQRAKEVLPVKLNFWGNLTKDGKGEQMTELRELAINGVLGFTDNQQIESLGMLWRLLEYLKPLEKPIALVPDCFSLKGNGVIREGSSSINYGLNVNPSIAESTAVASILEVVAVTQTPVHLMRISTHRSIELIAWGKSRGIPVTASTTWMHMLLDSEAIASYDPNLRLNPPLGNPEDRTALINGISEGVIDMIAVDHHAYTYEEKTVPFAEAPPGTIGLELALPLLWQELVATKKLSAVQLWKALSSEPRKYLGEPLTSIKEGSPLEFIIFDPNKSWEISLSNLSSLSHNTFWLGHKIKGKVTASFIK
ncbi:dihydroorotase [Candidatus Atelocyanobacterium thalassae]|uniref:Dihydroorotase n=1 Tax=Atelocyanobacterium thalassa (isolate ALOHA) TaxID=1453429 RepID=D3EN48_ATETH|nr:dihydroorotase [Candidatus Atelocyanobacterium thalassa]ADB94898.1 dihydroorotase [Candidatus Atelocyanobacterium thalassa isolate ALOHA]|tara:strand:+ start:25057 stop:26325 length:1269 start_codon:yes stop_codon:yes gene_type:complete